MAESVDPLKKSAKSESANCLPREMIHEIYKATLVVGVTFDQENLKDEMVHAGTRQLSSRQSLNCHAKVRHYF